MATAPAPPPTEPEFGKGGSRLEELGVAGTILAAVGGGLGVLGLVAFFGAAILWVRMDTIDAPANEAIAVVPKSVLVTTGASFLAPAVLLAIMLLALLYLADRLITWLTDLIFLPQKKKKLAEAEKWARREREDVDRALENAEWAADRALLLKATSRKSVAAGADPQIVKENADAAKEDVTEAQIAAAKARPVAKQADEKVAKAEHEVEAERSRKEQQIEAVRTGLRFVLVILVLCLAAAPGLMLSTVGLPSGQVVLVAVAVAFLSTLCLAILRNTNFAWFSVAIVLSVGLLNGLVTYYRTKNDPKVEPAALLRSHGGPVFGFFVAQTSDRVYLATQANPGKIRLDAISREEVIALVIGDLERPTEAEEHAIAFAHRLCLRAGERRPTGRLTEAAGGRLGEEVARGCTAADLRRLENRAILASGSGLDEL